MLGPNVNVVGDALAEMDLAILRTDSFAFAAQNTAIGKLSPDPDWLPPLRNELKLVAFQGAQWQQAKPTITTAVFLTFSTYQSLFQAVMDTMAKLTDEQVAQYIELLQDLRGAARQNAVACRNSETLFDRQIGNLRDVEAVFSASLAKAWQELANEEKAIAELASNVTRLQMQVDGLGQSLTAAQISGGMGYVQNQASLIYSLLSPSIQGVPYLTVVSLVYTTGKLFYDMIVTDKELQATLAQLAEQQLALTHEVQAAALTKSVIQLINDFDKALLAVGGHLPRISAMWDDQADRLQMVINSLQAGAKPSLQTDIVSMPAANATWLHLSELVVKMMAAPKMGERLRFGPGTPVARLAAF